MYRVYVHTRLERVVVTRKRMRGWKLLTMARDWGTAYRRALWIAQKLDFVLEWELEDQLQALHQAAALN